MSGWALLFIGVIRTFLYTYSMADNYLERKMEEHRRGPMPAYRRHVTSRGVPPGTVSFPFPVRRILVLSAGEGTDSAAERNVVALRDSIVEALAATGCRVAFAESDIVWRNRLAQTTGACGVAPGDTDIVSDRWEGFDSSVTITANAITTDARVYTHFGDSRHACIRIPASGGDTGAAVRAVLWSLVEGNDYLLDTIISIGC